MTFTLDYSETSKRSFDENEDILPSRIEWRWCRNDVDCSSWKIIPDLISTALPDLISYLTKEFCCDPELTLGLTWNLYVWQDKFGNQYRGVENREGNKFLA